MNDKYSNIKGKPQEANGLKLKWPAGQVARCCHRAEYYNEPASDAKRLAGGILQGAQHSRVLRGPDTSSEASLSQAVSEASKNWACSLGPLLWPLRNGRSSR